MKTIYIEWTFIDGNIATTHHEYDDVDLANEFIRDLPEVLAGHSVLTANGPEHSIRYINGQNVAFCDVYVREES